MKILTLVFWLFATLKVFSFEIDTNLFVFEGHYFYQITSMKNSKLIIFLHGGVKKPVFQNHQKIPSLKYLLEGNDQFVETCLSTGFDLLIPITDDSLNWLTNHRYY
jgi:hypothetical protein